jgi:hypothetical protein
MSNPSDIVNVVSESSPHYSRSEFYSSLAIQCTREEKKVFNRLGKVLKEEREKGGLKRSEQIIHQLEYLTELTTEYNNLAQRMRKIAADSFS